MKKGTGPKQQEDAQRIAELKQRVKDLVRETEQYHTNEGLLAKVEREATQGDKLQEDLDRMKWQKLRKTELSLLQEEKEHAIAKASRLRAQFRAAICRNVSIPSSTAGVSRPQKTRTTDSHP
ncbi:hypothetical protein R1flu_009034 [Riccia fluitans]|uniref:Uncharacterized protein n=1 Tax=Riccia fluitans TaxID=41844 RepID=A0ABD1Z531_9MARC